MRKLLPNTLILILSFAAAAPALAVYKCIENGKTQYSDISCTDGTRLEAADKAGVSAADAADARERHAKQKALATQIDKAHAREDAARDKQLQAAARNAQVKKAKCLTLSQKAKWAAEDAASASAKASAKARTKAQRAAEQYDARCKA